MVEKTTVPYKQEKKGNTGKFIILLCRSIPQFKTTVMLTFI